MTYHYAEEKGPQLTLENDGAQTTVRLGSSDGRQQQSQSTGFQTGAWKGEPTLYRKGQDLLVVLPTEDGEQGIRISGDQIQHEKGKPATDGAEKLSLQQGEGKAAPKMKPMEPMKPMAPMKPMQPMGH